MLPQSGQTLMASFISLLFGVVLVIRMVSAKHPLMSPQTSLQIRTYIGARLAERPILSAQSCGRNVETVLTISSTLIIAKGVSSGHKRFRVGIVANTLQPIRGRAWEPLLRTVLFMFQGL